MYSIIINSILADFLVEINISRLEEIIQDKLPGFFYKYIVWRWRRMEAELKN